MPKTWYASQIGFEVAAEYSTDMIQKVLLLEVYWSELKSTFDFGFIVQDGMTALHRAAIIGRDSMVRFLLKSGADVRAMDKVNSYTD